MIRWERVVLPIVMGEDSVGILVSGGWEVVGQGWESGSVGTGWREAQSSGLV